MHVFLFYEFAMLHVKRRPRTCICLWEVLQGSKLSMASAAMAVDALVMAEVPVKICVTLRPKMAVNRIIFGRRAHFLDPRLFMSRIRGAKSLTRRHKHHTGWNCVAFYASLASRFGGIKRPGPTAIATRNAHCDWSTMTSAHHSPYNAFIHWLNGVS